MGVVAASSECLRAVLATKMATFVLSKLEEQSGSETASEWCLYLEPFKPNKKKKVEKLCTIITSLIPRAPSPDLHVVLHAEIMGLGTYTGRYYQIFCSYFPLLYRLVYQLLLPLLPHPPVLSHMTFGFRPRVCPMVSG